MEYSRFVQRDYRFVSVADGYAGWAPDYEDSIPPELSIDLLERIRDVDWSSIGTAVDLACGTGRVGAWMKERGVHAVIGVDLTPEMLEIARGLNVYDELIEADITRTPLVTENFDLVTEVLADDHLPDLAPLYAEVARLLKPGGRFLIVGAHPHFHMKFGIPANFENADGEAIGIETYVHLFEEHVRNALGVGFELDGMHERIIDADFVSARPGWKPHAGHPGSFMFEWRLSHPIDRTSGR